MTSDLPPEEIRVPIARDRGGVAVWGAHHLQALLSTLGRRARDPVSALMTISVIAFALALPAGVRVLIENAGALTSGWSGQPRITAYLATDVPVDRARALGEELRGRPEVRAVDVLDPEQALAEYRRLSGIEDLDTLLEGENPMPSVLTLVPLAGADSHPEMEALARELRERPEVDLAQVDLDWIRRLDALLDVARRALAVLAVALAAGVLVVVGNTIRLGIDNRREEIEVARLCGATDAFVRRPFLYDGVLLGLLGGALAAAMVALTCAAMASPVARVAALYQSDFRLAGVDLETGLGMCVLGAALGLAGAWLAVGRHLRVIEPR